MLCHSGLRHPGARACASRAANIASMSVIFPPRAICAPLGGKPVSEYQRELCQVATVSLQKRSDVSRDCISFFGRKL